MTKRILFASFEAAPFCQTGGLGDVAGALPRALQEAGVDISVILPKHHVIPEVYRLRMQHLTDFRVQLSWRDQYCGIETLQHGGITWYFVDNEYYFKRSRIYGDNDDAERAAFFSLAVAQAANTVPELSCDLIHCNDWHTALIPVYLKELYQSDILTVFTIHNLKFQGWMNHWAVGDLLGLWGHERVERDMCYGDNVNLMRGAIAYADAVTTVSPTYAKEICTPEHGEGLQTQLAAKGKDLVGILNGIDPELFNPQSDSILPERFTEADMRGKAVCKQTLQHQLGLQEDPAAPLFCIVCRLTEQKGLDLVVEAMPELLKRGAQLAVAGAGEPAIEDAFRRLMHDWPGRIHASLAFSTEAGHTYYAASDFLLMPSRFEPCGLSQITAMRYGCVPIVRATGGLCDTVYPYGDFRGTGFLFKEYSPKALLHEAHHALDIYFTDKLAFARLRRRCMERPCGWSGAVASYRMLYRKLRIRRDEKEQAQ